MSRRINNTSMQQTAQIVLLVCGNSSTEDVPKHRAFLEETYEDAIAQGLVRLEDAPSHSTSMSNFRKTYYDVDSDSTRIYWRTKQNLDVAATLQATAGASEFVMLLEDDTSFQPGFAGGLKDFLMTSISNDKKVPLWSEAEFGFGYSGVLIHASDGPVYEQLHSTFFDKNPCDLLKMKLYVKSGVVRDEIVSDIEFSNGKKSYLLLKQHPGKMSTLPGQERGI